MSNDIPDAFSLGSLVGDKKPRRYNHGQICKFCPAMLSQYNNTGVCALCTSRLKKGEYNGRETQKLAGASLNPIKRLKIECRKPLKASKVNQTPQI